MEKQKKDDKIKKKPSSVSRARKLPIPPCASGRPRNYDPSYHDKIVYEMCLLGLTDRQLSEYFLIAESVLNVWKLKYPSFSESIREGREKADAKVVTTLLKRAMGYEVTETRSNELTGETITSEKHIPPDTKAIIYWLGNRHPDRWKTMQTVEHLIDEKLSSRMLCANNESLLPTQEDIIDVD